MGGRSGRYRTNVWDYPGVGAFRAGRSQDLATHPTVKPLELVADAITDCSKRNDLVLDAFAGSGTTLLAAENCGRRSRCIEWEPIYCDAIIQRFEQSTRTAASLIVLGGCPVKANHRLRTRGPGA